jgi:hypothetical protein
VDSSRANASELASVETRFIQICASQNDLFALDAAGNVYQYNFNTTTWEKLATSRSADGPRRSEHS